MVNLLPKLERKKIDREYKMRIAIIYLFFVSTAIFIGLILLLPSYFIADINEKYAKKEIIDLENSTENTEREEINSMLRDTKEKLELIAQTEDSRYIHSIIDELSNALSGEILISNMVYREPNSEGAYSLSVEGVAKTRDSFITFTKLLDEIFEDVVFPPQILASEKDIGFNLSIKSTHK